MIQEKHISVWNNCLNFIQNNIDIQQFNVWFRQIKAVSLVESVLTVDDMGYLKTKKTFGDSIVTATFTFNGKQYSDSCLVHVGVPAEGVDLNKGRLSLKTGESAQLEAVFNPKDTTNTKCYWYSEDEAVARVDENGLVTAVAPGKTVIYIISDYGNYYSSCKTEVTD